jgi:hypothetical protein
MTNQASQGNSMRSPDQTAFLPPSSPAQPAMKQQSEEKTLRPPRLSLLATVLLNPIILVGYYLYLYGPGNTCVAGPLVCNFGEYAAILQIGIILAGCIAIWLLLFLLARWLVETPHGERNQLIRGLRAITDTSKIRPMLLAYGLLLALGLSIGLVKHQINPPIAVLCLFTIFACLHSALGSESRRTRKVEAQTHE